MTDFRPTAASVLEAAKDRDLRFYDEENLMAVLGNESAGSRIRRLSNPRLDEAGAKYLLESVFPVVLPLMDERELGHVAHCLRFCPKVVAS